MFMKTKPPKKAANERFCPECGTSTSDSNPGSPCPACLMNLGLKSWQDHTGFGGDFHSTEFRGADDIQLDPDQLAKHFPQLEIQRLIGRGGMGSVYCARQKSLDRLIALKIIKPDPRDPKGFADRFVREAKALARLSHPNIVTVHDFGQVGDLYYFMMEFVDGVNLRQMIRDERLDPQTALQIVPSICDALQFAHDHGIVHRDIKPENILIDTEGNVKIADFGLAKLLNQTTIGPSLTKTNHVMGTMHYMAPEQFERPTDVDHRADIYSLGVVFYELLTGELPLGRFAPPSKKVAIDVRLDEIVLQTLEKEPELRYQQIGKVKTDVQSVESYNRQSQSQLEAAHVPAAAPQSAQGPIHNTFNTADWPQSNPQPPVKPAAKRGVTADPSRQQTYLGVFGGGSFWHVLATSQTYKNMLYLLLSFPLGIIYFVILITGLSAGIGTLIVWIGVPILLGTLLLAKAFVGIESTMTRKLLRTPIRTVHDYNPPPKNIFQRTKRLAFSGRSWLNVLYLILKFPLGIISFVSLVTLLAVPLSFLAAPILIYIPGASVGFGFWEIDTMSEASGMCLVGFLMMFLSGHVLNGVTFVQAQFSRLCLSRRQRFDA